VDPWFAAVSKQRLAGLAGYCPDRGRNQRRYRVPGFRSASDSESNYGTMFRARLALDCR